MAADIVPVLAAITGVPEANANALFAEAWAAAKAQNGGRADTRAYTEAVMLFRSAAPFALADLQMGWKAKEELESAASVAAGGNTLPMPR